MKTILVPTDFSECAEYALKHACLMAKKTKAKIFLLHVIPSDKNASQSSMDGEWMGGWAGEISGADAPLMMKLLKDTKKKMENIKSLPFCDKIEMRDFVAMGDISEMINATARKEKADIIIMGTHGAKELNEILIGSNAEHVVRDAEVPVISIQNEKGKFQLKKIVFATDFSEETKYVFPYVKMFADTFGAKLQLVRIISDSNFKARNQAQKEAETFLKENGFGKYPITILHDIRSKAEGISRFAEHEKADLIALGTHGRHGLAHFLKGSIAEDVVNYAFLPVLTVNFHKKLLTKAVKGSIEKKKVRKESNLSLQIPSI